MPISVAFSTNHSMRSMFFVGAMAMCMEYFLLGTDTVSLIEK